MGVWYLFDFIFHGGEFLELIFIVLQRGVLLGEFVYTVLNVLHPKPFKFLKPDQQFVYLVFGALDGASQKQDDFHDLLITGDHFIETCLLVIVSFGLFPVEKLFGTSEHRCSGFVYRSLDLFLRRVQLHFMQVQLKIYFEKGFGLSFICNVSLSADPIFHSV